MITLLSGGTGTPKLLRGFIQLLPQEELTVIVNTTEDTWLPHGYLSPDIDTVIYTLAGIINEETWYGVRGDTFATHEQLLKLGFEEFMNIGDLDRATHIIRGELLRQGLSLEEATHRLCRAYGVRARVLPMSNQRLSSVIVTPHGEMNLHEYLIKHRSKPEVEQVRFEGEAEACDACVEAVDKAEFIVIGPSNPVTSILPILSLENLREALKARRERVVAVSPMVGGKPVSGPADKFMRALGIEPSSRGVAELYNEVAAHLVVDEDEAELAVQGMSIHRTKTVMRTPEDSKALAEFLMQIMRVTPSVDDGIQEDKKSKSR